MANYFIKHDFSSNVISTKGLGSIGFSQEEKQSLQRKVEIKIYLQLPAANLLKKSFSQFEKTIIDTRFGGNITTKSGTHLFIPDKIFIDKDSNDVKGKIIIFYREFRSVHDFLQRNIPFNDNRQSRLFNSVVSHPPKTRHHQLKTVDNIGFSGCLKTGKLF